jgi:acetolactate synthase I/II/III large subunit
MNGAHTIIKTLIKEGVTVTFGFPGGSVIPLFDAYLDYKGKLKNILVRHEQGAAHAAEGYARASGKPGVCIATSGPGATNLVTGIMDAYMDSTPIIAFGGQVPTSLIGNDAFQESDMMGITLPITKHNFQVRTPNQMASTIMKSFKIASEGRPGPVYIDLPKDTQVGEVTEPIPEEVSIAGFQPTLTPNPLQIKKAAEAIVNSKKPLLLVGQGVIISEASKELHELVEIAQIPVTTTYMAKGAFDEYHDLSLGSIGMHGRKIANYATIHSDLLISLGCRFSDRITGNLKTYAENAKVIHADVDPAEIGKNVKVDIPIVGDAKNIISALVAELKNLLLKSKISKGLEKQEAFQNKPKPKEQWVKKIKEFKASCDKCVKVPKTARMHPRDVMYALNGILKPEDIVVTGVGQHQMFAGHFLKMRKPRTFITSGGAGTMGYGFPAAIGAKVAKPDSNVFLIDGDGSFQMTLQELATVKEAGIKVIILIMNNSWLGMVRQWLELFFDKRYSEVHLGDVPDFVKIAEAYNLKGIKVKKKEDLDKAIKQAISNKETTIVDVLIDKESNILPMLPPGGHIKDAFGGCMAGQGKFFEGEL